MTSPPELSICIPTHHGRASDLAVALDSILAELEPSLAGSVEICISDNASHDATERLVRERQQRQQGVIHYRRNAADLGAGRNMLRAAALARGRWIWLFSSDDAIEIGALRNVLADLRAHPQVAGLSVNRRLYERDLVRPSWAIDTEPPTFEQLTPLRGRAVVDALGLYAMYMSAQLVRASEWRAACVRLREDRLAASLYPHAWVIIKLWIADRPWLWEPRAIVKTRLGNTIFGEGGFRSLDAMLAGAIRDQRRLWQALAGGRRARRQLARLHQQVLPAGQADNVVLRHLSYAGRDRCGAVAMLAASTAAFWWSGRFWRESLRALVLIICGRPVGDATRERATTSLASARPVITCEPESCPTSAVAGKVIYPVVRLANRGPKRIRSRPTLPVNLAGLWTRTEEVPFTQITDRVGLPGRLRPGEERRLPLPMLVPSEPGEYTLQIGALIEGLGWYAHGAWSATCEVRAPSPQDLG